MKKTSIILLTSTIIFWISIIVGDTISKNSYGWIILPFYISTLIFTIIESKEKGLRILSWSIGSLFLPFFIPFILVFYPSQKGKTKGIFITKSFFGNILSMEGKNLTITQSLGKEFTFNLEKLRYIFAIIPDKFWSILVHSSQRLSCFNLDDLSEDEYSVLSNGFKDAIQKPRIFGGLSEFIICIADFNNNYAQINFKQIRALGIDFFSLLGKYRELRQKTCLEWIKKDPQIKLPGKFWMSAILDKTGFRRGSKLIHWKNVELIKIHTTNDIIAKLYLIPKGKNNIFSFGKHKYRMLIPIKRKNIYMAECNFWRSIETI